MMRLGGCVLAGGVAVLSSAFPALARDEDGRKLKSQRPAYEGPAVVGREIPWW